MRAVPMPSPWRLGLDAEGGQVEVRLRRVVVALLLEAAIASPTVRRRRQPASRARAGIWRRLSSTDGPPIPRRQPDRDAGAVVRRVRVLEVRRSEAKDAVPPVAHPLACAPGRHRRGTSRTGRATNARARTPASSGDLVGARQPDGRHVADCAAPSPRSATRRRPPRIPSAVPLTACRCIGSTSRDAAARRARPRRGPRGLGRRR